ncbi:MAG: hypothetical protein Q8N10_14095 [Phenylobacterium sp.]|uniref:ATP-grasp domain-containing protein n=1 Tax=Phenylobacterium sp. TaxID=1871053 RepID=UPI00271CEA0F|nr:hypothetical protein [Phenylobacterium sp.]MDO8912784.1 hypothetical protein [Phenylobacterium sp.]MDP3101617.1 hypothetical protein [Phenylobacterium sp.]
MSPGVDFKDYLLLMGVPDDGRVLARGQGLLRRPTYVFSGTCSYLSYLGDRLAGAREIWFAPPAGPMSLRIAPGPMVNYLADPDIYGMALAKAERLARAMGRPCLNPPGAVLRSGRDKVARALEGMPGVVAPRTERLSSAGPQELARMIADLGMTYPVLIRPVGAYGGKELLRMDRPEDLEGLVAGWMCGAQVYVTEFHPFADPDGVHRKYRLAVIGDQIILRHVIIGDTWLLHADSQGVDTEADEEARLASFQEGLLPVIAPAVHEIARRLGLDVFGIDCHLDQDGRLLVFESNACMNFLARTVPPPNMWDAPVEAIRTALLDLLADPTRWRHAGDGGSPGTPI